MSERAIDSFFTKIATPKKMTATNRTAATASTSTSASAADSTASSSDGVAADSGSKRKRDENGDEKESDEHDDKKLKGDETDAAASADNCTATTASTASAPTAAPANAHWTANLPSLLDPSWQTHLSSELTKPYFKQLCTHLVTASKTETIYPPPQLIFHAFTLTPFDSVSVVILGQDPYHDVGQAEGLAFSVPHGQKVPSSLYNIYKELRDDGPGFVPPKHGHLTGWAQQGVLLLNTALTVTAHKAGSHSKFGWTQFTDAVIRAVNKDKRGVVFILWGAHAQKKEAMIDTKRHHVIKSVHPSGLSASRGFFGSKPFSKCNAYLRKEGKPEIDWKLKEQSAA